MGGRCAAANAHQQLRAIIITASSDNIIIAQSGGESEAICRLSPQLGGAGEIPHLCAAGWESLIILMRGWQRRERRPRHASSHLWDKRRLAFEAWRHLGTGSVNPSVETRCNKQVSNWSWLRGQGRTDAEVPWVMFPFGSICRFLCLLSGLVPLKVTYFDVF